MKKMRKRASDFSPCEGEKVLEVFKRRADFGWSAFSGPSVCFTFFFELGVVGKEEGALPFHLTPMSPSPLPGLPLFPASTTPDEVPSEEIDILGDGRIV